MRSIALAVVSSAVIASLFVTVACDPPAAHDEPTAVSGDEDDLQFRTTYGSGTGANPPVYGNTSAIGDHAFNELDALGELHDGSKLRAVYPWDPATKTWGSAPYAAVWIEANGELRGRLGDVTHGGSQMQGARFVIEKAIDGGFEARELTIDAYSHDVREGLHRYVLAYPNRASYGEHKYARAPRLAGDRRSACVPDEQGNIEAVLLGGYHVDLASSKVSARADTLMFACLSGALGKALRWGYRPGAGAVDDAAYQAAIHMVRADYCGDGVSWTEPGQEIDLHDRFAVNDWKNPGQFTATEAIWGPDGALCLGTPRLQGQFTADDIECPNGPLPACGALDEAATFAAAGALWTRIWPQ